MEYKTITPPGITLHPSLKPRKSSTASLSEKASALRPDSDSATARSGPPRKAGPTGFSLFRQIILENCAVVHHKAHVFQFFNALQRISRHSDHFRVRTGRNNSNLSFHVQHLCSSRARRLNRIHPPP